LKKLAKTAENMLKQAANSIAAKVAKELYTTNNDVNKLVASTEVFCKSRNGVRGA